MQAQGSERAGGSLLRFDDPESAADPHAAMIEPDTLAAIMNTGIACSETTNVILCAKRTAPVVAQPQQAP